MPWTWAKMQMCPGMALEGLRKVYGRLDEELFWLAARAVQIVDWTGRIGFAGAAGSPSKPGNGAAKECPKCGLLHFPVWPRR